MVRLFMGKRLRDVYRVPDHKIEVIAHGIPDMPFTDPIFYTKSRHFSSRFAFLGGP
jgi:hypothetical protein